MCSRPSMRRSRPERRARTTSPRIAQFIAINGGVESEVIDKFRNGGGVPYSSFTRFHEAAADVHGPIYDANLVSSMLPLVPGIIERLEAGIDVADIGTGSGHAINVMAKAFPKSNFVGYDFSDEAVERGRAEAAAWGLTNASFEAKDVATLDDSRPFDFITTFDAIHDQAKPGVVVRGIHGALKAGGYWLCVDVRASSHVGENVDHPLGTFGYTMSCMHCMTVSLAYGGEGLGTMWGVQKARELFTDSGFEHDRDPHRRRRPVQQLLRLPKDRLTLYAARPCRRSRGSRCTGSWPARR